MVRLNINIRRRDSATFRYFYSIYLSNYRGAAFDKQYIINLICVANSDTIAIDTN